MAPGLANDTVSADELLWRVGQGDGAAFAQLYDLLAARVYGLVERVVGDPAQAEELTQEALLEVWRTAARYRPERGPAAGWVLTIAHRMAVDRVRAETSGAERIRRAATADPPYDQVMEGTNARLEHQQIFGCLKGLTPRQSQALLLAYYGGYTCGEVAELVGATLPTVKTLMRDGLIRLRDCLGPKEANR